jgi:hypothetical protein
LICTSTSSRNPAQACQTAPARMDEALSEVGFHSRRLSSEG